MAQATINTITIETPVQEVVTVMKKEEKQTGVRLELSMEEAGALRVLFSRVGGNPERTARGLIDNMASALDRAGVPDNESAFPVSGDSAVYFRPLQPQAETPQEQPKGPRKFQKGDRVKIVCSTYGGHPSRGEGGIGTVVDILSNGAYAVVVDGEPDADRRVRGWHFLAGLELVSPAPQRDPQVGDIVELLPHHPYMTLEAGEKLRVVSDWGYDGESHWRYLVVPVERKERHQMFKYGLDKHHIKLVP